MNDNPIRSCLAPVGPVVAKQLQLHLTDSATAVGDSLVEGDTVFADSWAPHGREALAVLATMNPPLLRPYSKFCSSHALSLPRIMTAPPSALQLVTQAQ